MNRNIHPPGSGRRRSISDPLAVALQPPANESQQEREGRLRAEQEAKKRSDTIDKMLRDSERRSRKQKQIKVLLLGQSESGKSTTLKQFQLLHTPESFHQERIAWRFVIYLNLLRSVRRILDAIAPEDAAHDDDDYDAGEPAAIVISAHGNGHAGGSAPHGGSGIPYERYLRSLAPLLELEQRLLQQLSDPEENADNEATHLPRGSLDSRSSHDAGEPLPRIVIPAGTSHSLPTSPVSAGAGAEPSVRTTSNWKKAFSLGRIQSPKSAHSGELQGWWEDPEDPVHTINRSAPCIAELWRDKRVRQKLAEKRIRLEESSGFYLDQLDRITAKMYFPTDDDVLKARLKTTGVVEHTFKVSNPEFRGVEWKIYDVGGARNQRQAWAPYFDDVDAIIFLAPISAFDQVLAEDPRMNRLEDSLYLWKHVISNKLLSNVNIILFLNKTDLLRKKLESGVKLRHHMPHYRDKPNNYESVYSYFKNKFGAIHQTHSPNRDRELYIHGTSVIDTRSTRTIIMTVRDIILQGNLKNTALI
ncbi:G-alpha-domain-containing protein [Phanerochaete sordida]|uniref:G-alpha-domain-containing protein n=1 Tax=Phanerochaete sordida TaxID=48140 RepID=A0A9P3LMD5_9APHY|nr:G-alpha-domain-containing protein [Phanerochaete sordida]